MKFRIDVPEEEYEGVRDYLKECGVELSETERRSRFPGAVREAFTVSLPRSSSMRIRGLRFRLSKAASRGRRRFMISRNTSSGITCRCRPWPSI